MNSPATKLTYHDYQFLPDDGKRYEVIDGDLYTGRDRDLKHKRYEHVGVREYWLVDPHQTRWKFYA